MSPIPVSVLKRRLHLVCYMQKTHSDFAVFTSYVFFCGGEIDSYKALTTGRLCNVIEVQARQQDYIVDYYPHLAKS